MSYITRKTQELGAMPIGADVVAYPTHYGNTLKILATKISDSRWHVRFWGGSRRDMYAMDLAALIRS